ncbi:MAG: protoheme IX farnesyltransferase [Candidatus Kapabacteria bacterium]|nr:protoheme IX farnesyltransferase [Candidatus Kapabacteria bacterium]
MKEILKIMYLLGKVKITLFVAISGALGYILATGHIDFGMIVPTLGIFILSCGSSALNQVQEWRFDALMDRTKNRPIPTSKLSPFQSLFISSALIIIGLSILYIFEGSTAFYLGIFAIVWYNAFYTPLKRYTAMAVVPGALIGAIPPLIGWVSGGGYIFDPSILSLCLFFFIWQIPHFWLLILIYHKDYERAGFPTLTKTFPQEQLKRITYIWIIALAASCMMIPMFGLSRNILTLPILFFAGAYLVWRTKPLLEQFHTSKTFRIAFMDINLYVVIVTLILSIDKLILFF